jgi:hypothetical protein
VYVKLRRRWRLWLIVVGVVMSALAQASAAGALTFPGVVIGTDFAETGSISLTGTTSSCASPKANPGLDPGTYRYDLYGFHNTAGSTQCITATVTSAGQVQPTAYLGHPDDFNPSNPQSGYIADGGFCTNLGIGDTINFSFNVPAGGLFYIVVADCIGFANPNVGYQLTTNANAIFERLNTTDATLPQALRDTSPSSTCNLPKATPATAGTHPHYEYYSILNNSGSGQCMSVTYTATGTDTFSGVFVAAYLNGFDPAQPQTNYLGDGSATIGFFPTTFSFFVPNGAAYVLVVSECAVLDNLPVDCLPNAVPMDFTVTVLPATPTAVTLRSLRVVPTRGGALVRWRTAQESSLLGFNVYRRTHRTFVRVNQSLIPSAFGDTTRGRRYAWLDRKARVGGVYRLQAVQLDGTRTWLGSTTD